MTLCWLRAGITVNDLQLRFGLYTSSFRLDASRTPDTPDPDRATRPAAAAAAAAALRGLMAPVRTAQQPYTGHNLIGSREVGIKHRKKENKGKKTTFRIRKRGQVPPPCERDREDE